jgi:hypothetical protein
MKIENPATLLFNQFGIVLDHCEGIYNSHMIRYLEDLGLVQIGEKEFERWSISVKKEFDAWMEQQELIEYMKGL